jgi:oxygen-dependent protoporphyrinogen oxidase
MLGGARHPEVVECSDDELRAIVAQEVGPLLGIDGPPVWSTVERYPRTLPRYDLEHPRRQGLVEQSLPENLDLLGNFRAGVGLTTLIPSARQLARTHAGRDEGERVQRS